MMDQLEMILDEDFDWSSHPRSLREIYKKTNFDSIFLKHIAKDVIRILSPQLNIRDDTHEDLLRPLEKFICDLSEDATPEDVSKTLQHIQTLNQPSKLCRRTLKAGDVTFACDDCGLDRTCVVCLDCFQKGPHKDHNYRMFHSDGGGCCDCGDMEAWKQHYACTDHLDPDQPNLALSDFEDIESRKKIILEDKRKVTEKVRRLPKRVASKYYLACQACLHYAQMMLTWDDTSSLPQPDLEIQGHIDEELEHLISKDSSSKNYFTVLLNDEVHTYDHVIGTLVKIIKCSKMTASIIASTINREGRSLIVNDNYAACKQVRDLIANVREGTMPLQVQVVHSTILAHQTFALKLLEWIRKMSNLCDGFKVLTAFTLLGSCDHTLSPKEASSRSLTLVEQIMLSNTTYWKIVRSEWNDLFVATLLSDYSIKEQFTRLLTRNYPKLFRDFILDDHDHSVSVLTMTTQVYTVPSLLCMLIEEENALTIIAQTLIETCKATKRDNPAITFESRHTFDMQGLKRGFYIILDLKYLINVKPTKWTKQLRKNVIEAVNIFLNLLSSMQGMDGVRRQLGQHLEYEPDWESGMTLQSRLINFITNLVTYCSYDEVVLIETLAETQFRLLKNGGYKMVTRELFDYQVSCIQYDVSTSPVSVHLPLTRFAAALILELMKIRPSVRIPYDEAEVVLVEQGDGRFKYNMIDIMEQSLRTQVMIGQFRSGMWRRNGYSLVNQILYFHGPVMRKEMFDRDILVLQECAAMKLPNEFLIHLLNKFQLFTWVNSEVTREPLVGPKAVSFHNDEEIMAQTMSLGEEFLQLLLSIISERYYVGIGKIEEDDVIKNEIIQLLCISPSTRSEISRKLCVNDNEMDCIKSVANLKRSSESSSGKYELKDEFYERFNPFFYHYSRRHQSNALAAQLKRKKNLGESLICCPPPKPVELTNQFKNLNELLKCDITLILIKKILTRALGPPEGSQECSTKAPIRFGASDLQLDQVLHLIGLGLWEQERNPFDYDYIGAANGHGIFFQLKECYEKTKRSKDLIYWLMRKTNQLIDDMRPKLLETQIYHPSISLTTLDFVKECFSPALLTCDTMKQDKKKRNSELAAKHQSRIMAMMKANQNKFLSNPKTQELMVETEKNEGSSHLDETSGTTTTLTNPIPTTSHLCILCRDEQTIGFDQPLMVLLAYVQRSSVLSKNRSERRIPVYALTPTNQIMNLSTQQANSKVANSPDVYSFTSDNSCSFDATFMTSDLFFGPHISTCGHAMHYECWEGFFDATYKRETSRPNRTTRHISYELEKKEILCPLCECISNTTLPLLPNYTNFSKRSSSPLAGTIFQSSQEVIEKSSARLSACLHALRGTVDMFKHIRHIKDVMTNVSINQESKYMRLLQPKGINDVLEELDESEALGLRDFINSIRNDRLTADSCSRTVLGSISSLAERIHIIGLDLVKGVSEVHHARIFMMNSWCVSYTIQTYERVSRFKASPLFEDVDSSRNLCLRTLLRFVCSSMLTHQSDMMQSLLVRKLRYLLINGEHLSSSPCCLDIDAFETFVSLFILLQKLYAHIDDSTGEPHQKSPNCPSSTGSSPDVGASTSIQSYAWATKAFDHEYFRNLLHLMVVLNIVQITVSMQNELTNENQSTHDASSSTAAAQTNEQIILHNFYKEIIMASGHPNGNLPPCNEALVTKMKHRLLPFLRSCAIFFFHLSDILPPDELRFKDIATTKTKQEPMEIGKDCDDIDGGGAGGSLGGAGSVGDEFEQKKIQEFGAICKYLVLPNDFSTLLQSQEARNLACSWLRHSRVLMLIKSAFNRGDESDPTNQHNSNSNDQQQQQQQQISNTELMPVKFIRQPHSVNRLVDLPYEYSELLEKAFRPTCTSGNSTCATTTSTMCLVCGAMLCSQCYSCQRDLNDLASNYQQLTTTQNQHQLPDDRQASSDNSGSPSGPLQGGSAASASQERQQQPAGSPTERRLIERRLMEFTRIVATAQMFRGSGNHRTSPRNTAIHSSVAAQQAGPSTSLGLHQQLVGSCTYHAYECSAGVGVFLRIRNSQILLMSGRSKGCYMPAPYIDDHGETDFGLMRGKPLHLNRQHYEKLQQMWLTHSIPEQISRTLEYSPYASSVNWYLH